MPLFRAEALDAQRQRLLGVPLRISRGWARGSARDTPVMLQGETAECGLACLAMVAGHHGHRTTLAALRERHAISAKGATLATLMRTASALHLTPRPLRAEPDALRDIALPCVLHWDFNHYVVLVRCAARGVVLHDPASGRRDVTWAELGRHYTGVALELAPAPDFEARDDRVMLPVPALVGRLAGWVDDATCIVACAFALQALMLAAPFYLQWAVDAATHGAGARQLIAALGIGFAGIAVLQAAAHATRGWLIVQLKTRLHLQLQSRLLHHLLRLPPAWFQSRQTADVLSRFESLHAMQRTLGTSAIEAVVDGAMALLTVAMMFTRSPRLALVGLVAAAFYLALRLSLYWPMRSAVGEQMIRTARQHGHLLESLRGIQAVKLHAHETERHARWQNLAVDECNAGMRSERIALAGQAANVLLFGLEMVATVWLGTLLVFDATPERPFSIGMLFAFIAWKAQFVQRYVALVDKSLELRMLGLHAERVGDVVLARPEPLAATGFADELPATAGIELDDVSFAYEPGAPPLIDRLSLRIEAGESVAIVGPSGCGKTTLVKLMLGLLEPTAGRITVNGMPLAEFGIGRLRRTAASVMQDDQLFAGSIADNICFFAAEPDPRLVERCARQAGLHDEIDAMPMRYETAVGDMGSVLSGGQKQRVLLARALYRAPRMLFLDEATSHLDVAGERRVNDAVRALALTRIIVAHRPETIASADRVIDLGRLRRA
ncbi:MAG: peptidase domain-containing ABC transporter [Proteobacteria bacterium]|nr:peptidase domain-containing ABC transporter [Pseudomonadota bacterium]